MFFEVFFLWGKFWVPELYSNDKTFWSTVRRSTNWLMCVVIKWEIEKMYVWHMLACRCEDCYDDVPASSSYFYPEKFFFEFSNLYNMATPWDALTIELLELRWLNVYIGCMTIKCLRHLANFKDWFIWSRYTGITSLQLCFTLKQPKNPGQASLIRFCPYKRNIPVHCRHNLQKRKQKETTFVGMLFMRDKISVVFY